MKRTEKISKYFIYCLVHEKNIFCVLAFSANFKILTFLKNSVLKSVLSTSNVINSTKYQYFYKYSIHFNPTPC